MVKVLSAACICMLSMAVSLFPTGILLSIRPARPIERRANSGLTAVRAAIAAGAARASDAQPAALATAATGTLAAVARAAATAANGCAAAERACNFRDNFRRGIF
jgi:hypothetical protein